LLRPPLRRGAAERLERGAGKAELEFPLDAARARACPARKKERVVAALDENARVRLEDVLVEPVLQTPVNAVRAEVVHEVREDRVREEVLPRAVRRGRQARALEREAEDDRVEVRQVRRRVDDGTEIAKAPNRLARPLHDDAPVERGQIERMRQVF